MSSEFLTTNEAAILLRCSKVAMRRWRVSGCGPRWTKAGRRVLYLSRELADWIKAQPSGGGEAAPK